MTQALASLILALDAPLNPFAWSFDRLVFGLNWLLNFIESSTHNYGWSIILLAGLVKLALWPLTSIQLKSMAKMQELAPQIKALQSKYSAKDAQTQQKLNTEMMALYKENNANPFAGCLPALLPIPIMIAFWQAIMRDRAQFTHASWMWIGSPLSYKAPMILATSLANLDIVLLGLYMISMFFTVRLSSSAVDEQQAQQQKIMAFLSPAMLGYFGYRGKWPSALILYWLTFNLFSMAQQFYMQRKFPRASASASPEKNAKSVASRGKEQRNQLSAQTSDPHTARLSRKKRARR